MKQANKQTNNKLLTGLLFAFQVLNFIILQMNYNATTEIQKYGGLVKS